MNKVFLCGRLGDNPKRLSERVVVFDVATDDHGQKDGVTWHRVKTFNELAAQCEQHLEKGREVVIDGRINNYKYEKNGATQRGSEVVANRVEFVGAGRAPITIKDKAPAAVKMNDVDGLPSAEIPW